MKKIIFWAEINSVRIEKNVDFDFSDTDDAVSAHYDSLLEIWVGDIAQDNDDLGEYGWRLSR